MSMRPRMALPWKLGDGPSARYAGADSRTMDWPGTAEKDAPMRVRPKLAPSANMFYFDSGRGSQCSHFAYTETCVFCCI